jgi:CheY-like chemotaxis protein
MQSSPIHVLLADDDEDDRLIFLDSLSLIRIPKQVTTVNDGVQLMQFLNAQDVQQLPDILFLDLNMPLKSGLECLKEIRANPVYNNLTIAIYSTSGSAEDIENTFIQGANVYIKKPSDFNQLVKVLTHVINVHWQYHTTDMSKENFVLSL